MFRFITLMLSVLTIGTSVSSVTVAQADERNDDFDAFTIDRGELADMQAGAALIVDDLSENEYVTEEGITAVLQAQVCEMECNEQRNAARRVAACR